MTASSSQQRKPLIATVIVLAVWLVALADWMWSQKLDRFSGLETGRLALLTAIPAAVVSATWAVAVYRRDRKDIVRIAAVASAAYAPVWHAVLLLCDVMNLDGLRVELAWWGTFALYAIGLGWVVWGLDQAAQQIERKRREELGPVTAEQLIHMMATGEAAQVKRRSTSNPLDPDAWFYGKRANKLNQSLTAFTTYSMLFLALFMLATQLGGCEEIYEMPAGGGQAQMAVPQTVKVEKVIKKKFVVNPFSAISFKVPPIDEIKLQLQEATAHQYAVGYGAGAGAGFAGGTKAGKVRFIRLEYQGGDWDQEFSTNAGCDYLMLLEYGLRTKQKINETVESRPVAQLKNFPAEKSPPFVYMTGQKNIQMSSSELKILKEYMLDKHGMIFADNGGSAHWHNQFFAMMKQILPNVQPVQIPLDDVIHRTPYQIPFLPYVAPHGGKEAYGWRVDGRLVAYYHPGDIGDAWSDDHAGVPREVWEACYQLGTNVIFYAHIEYAKWLESRQKK